MDDFRTRPKRKKKKKYTFMVVPHSDSGPISLPVPFWLINGFAIFGVISLLVFIYFTVSYARLEITEKENQSLKLTNDYQQKELKYLRDITQAALNNLEELAQLESQVKELVGLEKSDSSSTVSRSAPLTEEQLEAQRFSGQGGSLTYIASEEDLDSDELIKTILQNVQKLEDQTPVKTEEMEKLEKDVKQRLDYLAAIPSGWPGRGRITSTFGWRKNPFNSRKSEFHNGLDIAASYGTPIRAAGAGKVIFTGWQSGYGYTVIINHGYGYVSYYHHNSKITISQGAWVKRGDLIARMGSTGRSTGTHVHFGVTLNGKYINPYNVLK